MYEQKRKEVNKVAEKFEKQLKAAKRSGSKANTDKVNRTLSSPSSALLLNSVSAQPTASLSQPFAASCAASCPAVLCPSLSLCTYKQARTGRAQLTSMHAIVFRRGAKCHLFLAMLLTMGP